MASRVDGVQDMATKSREDLVQLQLALTAASGYASEKIERLELALRRDTTNDLEGLEKVEAVEKEAVEKETEANSNATRRGRPGARDCRRGL